MSADKYITFKREDFMKMMGHLGLPPWMDPKSGDLVGSDWDAAVFADMITSAVETIELPDAVVIRRQDKFASPCLATYASMIALVAQNTSNADQGHELMRIADYFEDQAQLAAAEGFKLPDL